jgi:sigma-E factor negative regulatory protein RseC
MHEQTGIVQKVEGSWAWVLTRRTDACSRCQHKGHCHIVEGMDKMIVKAKTTGCVKPGDQVVLHLNAKTKFKGMFILYIFPVLGLLLGAFSAQSLSSLLNLDGNTGLILFTLLGLVSAFLLARFCSARLEAKGVLTPSVSRIRKSMIRKAIHITITIGLVLGLLGTGVVPASYPCGGTCCMQSAMAMRVSVAKSMANSMGCCCNPQRATDFSQGCPLEMARFPNVGVTRPAENPGYAAVTLTNHIQKPPELSEGSSLEVWSFGTGPPLPLFLLNQSFLC